METAATVVAECSRSCSKLSTTITAPVKAGAIPAQTMIVDAAEAAAEVAAEAAAVARRIATPLTPTGGGLQSYQIASTLAVECSTSYTAMSAAAALAAEAHILPMIGKTMMRVAGGATPATTAATATSWPDTASAT
jgi:hypothetical protein